MDGRDAAIFCYLEEVDVESGRTNYVTEGVLRVSHRETVADVTQASRIGAFDRVKRSFSEEDMSLWPQEEFMNVNFVLEPIAYHIPGGNVIRLVFAGGDKDNFFIDNIDNLASKWRIDTSKSQMSLPIADEKGSI